MSETGTNGGPRAGRRRRIALAAAVAVTVIGLGVVVIRRARTPGGRPETVLAEPGAARGRSVLLVTLDTLRADHVGCYGYDLVETPVMDRLAGEGVRFAHAVTSAPMTLPAHCTIMTGLYPPVHGVRDNGLYRLADESVTLAEVLRDRGYATAAFVAAFVLDARYGLDQGFEHYDDELTLRHRPATPTPPRNPQRPADAVVDAAVHWLDAHRRERPGRPFFVWLHLFDPHLPYEPPEPYRSRYSERPYDGEIAFADEQLGRVVRKIEDLGLADSLVTVLVGDHGEGLGDHGERTHRRLIYGSTMRVPLIVHAPGTLAPGHVVEDVAVATVDVMPTVLELLGVAPPGACDGVPVLSGRPDPRRLLYMETLSPQLHDGWAPLFGVRRRADKYIDAPAPEYYDLAADPHEQRNLWTEDHATASALAEGLDELMASFPAPPAIRVTPTERETTQLRALGYLGGVPADREAGPAPDPKVMIRSLDERLAAIELVRRGRHDEAVASLDHLVRQSPGSAELWSLLSRAQHHAGRPNAAVAAAREAAALRPDDAGYACALASQLRLAGQPAEAEAALSEAERRDPTAGSVWLLRARWALAEGSESEARRLCRHAVAVDPVRSTADAHALFGLMAERQGRLADAEAAFEAALAHDPRHGAALLARAKLAAGSGDPGRAIELLTRLVDGQPEFEEGGRLLGRLYFATGDPATAEGVFRVLLRRDPRDAAAHFELSRVLAAQERIEEALDHLERAAALGPVNLVELRTDPSFRPLRGHPRLETLRRPE